MTEQVSGLSEQKAITDGCQGALAGGAVSESLLEGRWAGMGEGGPLPPHPPRNILHLDKGVEDKGVS